MATELVQIAVGRYDETVNGRIPGVFSRDVTAPSLTAMMRPILALQPAHMDWMEDRVGRYPFDAYGSLVVDADLGFALETQTLSLYDKRWFTAYTQDTWDPTMVHELVARVVRQQRLAVRVERPVAQRGPRELVRVRLRRGEGLPRGRHRRTTRTRPATPRSWS